MKKLSLCLAFCLILTMIPIGTMLAFAEGTDPWKLGDTAYSTLGAALEAAVDGDTVYLTQDLTEAVAIEDLGSKELTIEGEQAADGSYPTISVDAITAITVTNGTLTLKNINAESSGKTTTATLVLGTGANVTLENVNLTNSVGAAISTTATDAVLTLESGEISAPARSGIEMASNTAMNFTMNGGTLTSDTYYGIQSNSGALKATIYGGLIHGKRCAVTGKADLTLTVFGGAFTNPSDSTYAVFFNDSSAPSTYNILGGTFEGGTAIVGGNNNAYVTFAYPDGATSLTLEPVMQTGASIYTYQSAEGIRFDSEINTNWLNYLTTKFGAENVEYGTMICPTDLLATDFSDFTLDNEEVKSVITATSNGTKEDDANTVISAALMNLQSGNETRDFAARTYIRITDDEGNVLHTLYSDEVATAKMTDLKNATEAA